MKIHLLGPSGSGTSTLGKALAARLQIQWFDSDTFFWMDTDPPFTTKRASEERKRFLKETLDRHDSWVLSGSLLKWGDYIREIVDVVIYKYVEQEERLRRLQEREKERFGERILPGGDMHENYLSFIDWAMRYEEGGMEIRSRASEEAWMSELSCRVIRLENALTFGEEIELVIEKITHNKIER